MLVKLKANRDYEIYGLVKGDMYFTNKSIDHGKGESYREDITNKGYSFAVNTGEQTYNLPKEWFDIIGEEQSFPKVQRVLLECSRIIPSLKLVKGNNIYAYNCGTGGDFDMYEGENFSARDGFIDLFQGSHWVVFKGADKIYINKDYFTVVDIEDKFMRSIKDKYYDYYNNVYRAEKKENVLDVKQDKAMTKLNDLVKEQMFSEEVKQKFIEKAKETTLKIKKLTKEIIKKEKECDSLKDYLTDLNTAFDNKDEDFLIDS